VKDCAVKMDDGPLISIVIPVYNGSDYLRKAIDSALAQTYRNVEIVVVNDGSRDGGATEAIALSYPGRVRYERKENGGVASALNRGIELMKGEYFSWLSHDDEYFPCKLSTQVECMRRRDDWESVFYSGFELIDEASAPIGVVRMPDVDPADFRFWLTRGSQLHGCSLLIRKEQLLAHGCFDEKLRTTQDYDLWFRMANDVSFVGMPDILVRARTHAAQGTKVLSEVVAVECDRLHARFFEEVASDDVERGLGELSRIYRLSAMAESFAARSFRSACQAATEALGAALRDIGPARRLLYRFREAGPIDRGIKKAKAFIASLSRRVKMFTKSRKR
jgi:glycosyltransferase involved in cell wall biosynthesis